MAVAFDNVSSVQGQTVTTLTTPAFTITSAANRAGLLGLSFDVNTPSSITGSIGGVSGSAIAGTDSGTTRTDSRSLQFGVTAPPSGSQTGTMSWTGTANAVLGAETASGVNQTTPFNNGTFATGTTSTPKVTITSASGDLTSDTVANFDGAGVDGSLTAPTQTSRWNQLIAVINFSGAGSTAPGAATVTHQWTSNAAAPAWTSSGANFKATVVVSIVSSRLSLLGVS